MSKRPAATADVVVHAHGPVSPADQAYAHNTLARLQRLVPRSALLAIVDIVASGAGGGKPRALVQAELDVDGHRVWADAPAINVRTAVDVLEVRLRRALEPFGHLSDG